MSSVRDVRRATISILTSDRLLLTLTGGKDHITRWRPIQPEQCPALTYYFYDGNDAQQGRIDIFCTFDAWTTPERGSVELADQITARLHELLTNGSFTTAGLDVLVERRKIPVDIAGAPASMIQLNVEYRFHVA